MIPAALVAPLALLGCTTIYNPATQRQETVLSTSVESVLGTIARAQMGLGSLKVGRVDPDQFERVQRIGQRIARVSDRQDLIYQFGVIRGKELNAFTLPGGTLYVYTGILEMADDDELAAVLGHEMGHAAARHVAKHLQADLGFTLLLEAASAAGASPESGKLVHSLYDLFSRGFSRQDELEADRLSLRYTSRAGFNPEGLIRFFEKMRKEHPEGPMEKGMVWQSTHPLTSDRIEQAKKEMARLQSQSAKFCPTCGREYESKTKFCPQDGTSLKEKK